MDHLCIIIKPTDLSKSTPTMLQIRVETLQIGLWSILMWQYISVDPTLVLSVAISTVGIIPFPNLFSEIPKTNFLPEKLKARILYFSLG